MQKLSVTITRRETVTTTETVRIDVSPEALVDIIRQHPDDKKCEEMIAVIASLTKQG